MRSFTVALVVAALSGCGGAGSDGSAPRSTAASGVPVTAAFPETVPTTSDGECSVPRTDPARPQAGPVGEVTDGVAVERVHVVDGGSDEVVVTFTVTSRPFVEAASGEQWVVTTLSGVRRFGEVSITSVHARRIPASICDDSAWVFALALDRPVERLELDDDPEVTLRIFLQR